MTLAPDTATTPTQLAPTDLAQFIRLDQCERYLKLRLRERAEGLGFLRRYGVAPQRMPPLLIRSGQAFEASITTALPQRFRTVVLAAAADRDDDHARITAEAGALAPGDVVILVQPRLAVRLGAWRLRGDIDLLRLERRADGTFHALIADTKSSTSARMEHRLQVACYHAMLDQLWATTDLNPLSIQTGIIYRQPTTQHDQLPDATIEQQRAAADEWFGVSGALLELTEDPQAYLDAVHDLLTGPRSTAARIAATPFAEVPYHLGPRCDGCVYNEFCMKWSAEQDDLSLVPYLRASDKAVLQRAGIGTTHDLARLKEFRAPADKGPGGDELVPAPGREELVRHLAGAWPTGPRLDELVHRARRYRRTQGDGLRALARIPGTGHGSLPYSDATQNPNLVRIYLDAQHDHLNDRLYLLSALIVGCEQGVAQPTQRRSIVHLSDRPPEDQASEARLIRDWIQAVLAAVVDVAAPDADGQRRAPIHLIFYDRLAQRVLLDGLGRHLGTLLGATPLYDFVTQLAAFDSPIASYLDEEIREHRNYAVLCQSLQMVAAYLRFDWNAGVPYRDIFHHRVFDFRRARPGDDGDPAWYTGRARFNSQIPLEYAYAAWGELPAAVRGEPDESAPYRAVTREHVRGFAARRLEAMEWIAADLPTNRLTTKRCFDLPDLVHFRDKARSLAHALDEFLTIERHVYLNEWKRIRHLPPERRALMGETLLVRYVELDQAPEVADQNREHQRRETLRQRLLEAAPDGQLTKEQQQAIKWSNDGLCVRLRLDTSTLDCALPEALALATLGEGDPVILFPRFTTDSRLPPEQRTPFTPTPRQLLYAMRGTLDRLVIERDAAGEPQTAYAEVTLRDTHSGDWARGCVFSASNRAPLRDGELYTLDPDPNSWYAYWCLKTVEALCAVVEPPGPTGHALYDRLTGHGTLPAIDPAGAAAQARFLAGLEALHKARAFHDFEPGKCAYIGEQRAEPFLLVQGPPGTGKSYATAFALFARLQGALAAGAALRIFISCKTHAATDVLLTNVREVQERLRAMQAGQPEIFARYFDARLLDLPLFRIKPREQPPPGVTPLHLPNPHPKGLPRATDIIAGTPHCVVAGTPGGIYSLIKNRWSKQLLGHALGHCLVLDEASQMNLPEALMAALPLTADGEIIVVGDHRQMPPIVQHDWDNEPRRSFQEYRAYESLFLTLLPQLPDRIRFEESFRLHADMAEFLRREVYRHDGIAFYSHQTKQLPASDHEDPFLAAVLSPDHPLVVVVHDEAASQVRNVFEEALITPILTSLADPDRYGLDAASGLGVVVPHRAQRAALQAALPELTITDPVTGAVRLSAIDTVERFQGGERQVIIVSTTESDRTFLLASSKFLLDPRRLTVALSRAKRKLILVAASTIFTLFSADEETFASVQLWKNLLRHTCTVRLWEGERHHQHVTVWGSAPSDTTCGGD